MPRRQGSGFFAVDDVVRDTGDFGDEGRSGAKALESFDAEHKGQEERG